MGDAQDKSSYPPPEEAAPSATSGNNFGREEDAQERPKRAKRSFLTQNACTRCRSKKSKCDGKRPVCERCEKQGAECVYDVAQEGLTRMQNLQQQLDSRTSEHGKLVSLFNALQHGSDQDATSILARLRMGSSIDELLEIPAGSNSLHDGSSFSHAQPQSQWTSSPMTEPGVWAPWGDPGSRTLSLSSESYRDDPRAYPTEAHDPPEPYYHSLAPNPRFAPPEQDGQVAMPWQGQGGIAGQQMPAVTQQGHQFYDPQRRSSDQMP